MVMKIKKRPVIIDTDPGVDDAAALILSFFDDDFDIKLITSAGGNISLNDTTNNVLHILDKFNVNIPVAKGADRPLNREPINAKHIHSETGLGYYIPKKSKRKVLKLDAVDAMYEVIKKYKGEITILALAPHTNTAKLLLKYPDAAKMIKEYICEGCSPWGYKKTKPRISFNMSYDPEAFKVIYDSGVKISIVPSEMGRELANFNKSEVFKLKKINDTGKLLFKMYDAYWEPGYKNKRIAINDTCVCMYFRFPELFKVKKTNMEINTTDAPGKTTMDFSKSGKVNYLYAVNRKKLHKIFFNAVKKLGCYKFDDVD